MKKNKKSTMLFEPGDEVDVLSNVDDVFNDFRGVVIGYKEKDLVTVADQDDNYYDCAEDQLTKVS